MVFLAQSQCNCCIKAPKELRITDTWHCKDCWDKYHNGIRDNDWLDKEEFER